jgi:four helix bundle protein
MSNNDFRNEMKRQTRKYALETVRLVKELPRGRTEDSLANQLLRSGTSVGANYRSACRGKSIKDFISKMGVVEEEADESVYWLELLVDSGILEREKAEGLINEGNQLTAICVSAIRNSRQTLKN